MILELQLVGNLLAIAKNAKIILKDFEDNSMAIHSFKKSQKMNSDNQALKDNRNKNRKAYDKIIKNSKKTTTKIRVL